MEDLEEAKVRTASDQYLRLFVIWLLSILCGGPTAGLNLFIPLLAENGLFADVCDSSENTCKMQLLLVTNMMIMLSSIATLGLIPGGLLFDIMGGRVCGIIATIGTALGSSILGLGVLLSSSTIVAVGVAVMDAGSCLSQLPLSAMMWHLPEAQGLLFAMQAGSSRSAAILPVLLRGAMSIFGVSLPTVFFGYAFMATGFAVLMSLVVPTQAEFLQQAQFVLGLPIPEVKYSWKNVRFAVSAACRVVSIRKKDALGVVAVLGMIGLSYMQYSSQLQTFGTLLFGDEKLGRELTMIQVQGTTFFSAPGAVAIGTLIDRTSLGCLVTLVSLGVLFIFLFGFLPSFHLQLVCVCVCCAIDLSLDVIQLRWVARYAPSNRFGMVSCVVFVISVFYQILLTLLWSFLSASFDGLESYRMPALVFGAVSFLLSTGLAARMIWFPLPNMVLIEGDEEELMSQNFGLKTLEDAEIVLRISRLEILRLLASQNMKERRVLVDAMKTQEVQIRWAQRAFEQGYEIPDLDHMSYFVLQLNSWENKLSSVFCCNQG